MFGKSHLARDLFGNLSAAVVVIDAELYLCSPWGLVGRASTKMALLMPQAPNRLFLSSPLLCSRCSSPDCASLISTNIHILLHLLLHVIASEDTCLIGFSYKTTALALLSHIEERPCTSKSKRFCSSDPVIFIDPQPLSIYLRVKLRVRSPVDEVARIRVRC